MNNSVSQTSCSMDFVLLMYELPIHFPYFRGVHNNFFFYKHKFTDNLFASKVIHCFDILLLSSIAISLPLVQLNFKLVDFDAFIRVNDFVDHFPRKTFVVQFSK